MRGPSFLSFWRDEGGAVAPLYAIALFGLVGMTGIAFDYGRLMAMDSELQNAADAAALAAATQLNGQTDAMNVAMTAANAAFATAASDYVNETRFSNVDDDGDGDTRPITQLTFTFWSGYDHETDTPEGLLDPETDDGEEARVVQVTVDGREVFYALTPVVGAISSGDVTASAMATLEQATCDVVPMMFCAPNPDFGTDPNDIGKGMRLHMLPNATDAFTPGNFGFLDIEYDTNGNPNRRMGINTQGGVCVGGVVESDPGDRAAEVPPFNTRFDRYENSASGLNCDSTAGHFCSAQNVRQNYVQRQQHNNQLSPDVPCNATPTAGGPWENRPEGGYPKESCIAAGTCNFGDGVTAGDWTPYMNRNHPGMSASSVPADGAVATRWEMYQWERDGGHMNPVKVSSTAELRVNGRYNVTNYCSYPTPKPADVFTPDESLNQKDRRVLTVAAVDCTGLNGREPVKILRWVDIFLVDSANTSTSDKEFMAELIGPAKPPGGGSGFQTFGRGKAVLIR
jgi:Flp pilus assembly protein TadG